MVKYAVLGFSLIACLLSQPLEKCNFATGVLEIITDINKEYKKLKDVDDKKLIPKFETPDINLMNCSHIAFACFKKEMENVPGQYSELKTNYNMWFQKVLSSSRICQNCVFGKSHQNILTSKVEVQSVEKSECARCSRNENIKEFLLKLQRSFQQVTKNCM